MVRFGQVLDSQGHTGLEHWAGTALQAIAYKQLQTLSRKEGNPAEAELFGYLARKFDPVTGERPGPAGEWVFGQYISTRNAAVFKVSGLMLLIFSALMVVAASLLIAVSHPTAPQPARRAKPVATTLVLTSAVGLLLSSATLYLTYRPYWYMFQHAILNGERSQARDLRDFLAATQVLPGVRPGSDLPSSFPIYFWTGVILLGVISLLLILLRHFLARPQPGGLQHSPRVP